MSSRLDRLKNHAEALEVQLAGAEGSAYASLSARYMDALKQIDELEPATEQKGTVLDELEKRRARREASGSGSA